MMHERAAHGRDEATPAARARSAGQGGGELATLQRAADCSPVTQRLQALQRLSDRGQPALQRRDDGDTGEDLQRVRDGSEPAPLQGMWHAGASGGAGVIQRYNSVTDAALRSAIHNLHGEWKLGTDDRTIAVWEIAKIQQWDFHFSAVFDRTGANMTKFHFTIRNGGKGDDAFAWFDVQGHNAAATAGARADAGNATYFQVGHADYKKIPRKIRSQFANIDAWAAAIVTSAAQYS